MKAPFPELKTTSSKLFGVSSFAPPSTADRPARASRNDLIPILKNYRYREKKV